jgi:hypothetical protein
MSQAVLTCKTTLGTLTPNQQFHYPADQQHALFKRIIGDPEQISSDNKSLPVQRQNVEHPATEFLGKHLVVLLIA